MANAREVVSVSWARTAIGDDGGSLKDIPPTELGARVVREAVARSKVDAAQIGQCVFGNVIHTEARDMYLSRVVKGRRLFRAYNLNVVADALLANPFLSVYNLVRTMFCQFIDCMPTRCWYD